MNHVQIINLRMVAAWLGWKEEITDEGSVFRRKSDTCITRMPAGYFFKVYMKTDTCAMEIQDKLIRERKIIQIGFGNLMEGSSIGDDYDTSMARDEYFVGVLSECGKRFDRFGTGKTKRDALISAASTYLEIQSKEPQAEMGS